MLVGRFQIAATPLPVDVVNISMVCQLHQTTKWKVMPSGMITRAVFRL